MGQQLSPIALEGKQIALAREFGVKRLIRSGLIRGSFEAEFMETIGQSAAGKTTAMTRDDGEILQH